ncbi:MAG TPA: HD domain-containing protein [Anaerolineae bacterium]|nr:HD domain-containing protein [Anaerolineae bacterium]
MTTRKRRPPIRVPVPSDPSILPIRAFAYSERYEQALRLATTAHRHQNRKGGNLPYISHPVHVSVILLRYGFSTDAAIAGLLHDVVEDQGVDLSEIEERFGPQVAELVAALSEHKTDDQGDRRPWEMRKREALEHMREGSLEVVAVKAADALHNARATALDARREGPSVWQRFTRGPQALVDHYRDIVQVARERMGHHPLVDELAEAVEELGGIVRDT